MAVERFVTLQSLSKVLRHYIMTYFNISTKSEGADTYQREFADLNVELRNFCLCYGDLTSRAVLVTLQIGRQPVPLQLPARVQAVVHVVHTLNANHTRAHVIQHNWTSRGFWRFATELHHLSQHLSILLELNYLSPSDNMTLQRRVLKCTSNDTEAWKLDDGSGVKRSRLMIIFIINHFDNNFTINYLYYATSCFYSTKFQKKILHFLLHLHYLFCSNSYRRLHRKHYDQLV